MNISQLLGPHVHPDFIRGTLWDMGYRDYPSFDLEHQDSQAYEHGFISAYHDDQNAKHERWMDERDFPREVAADRRRGL